MTECELRARLRFRVEELGAEEAELLVCREAELFRVCEIPTVFAAEHLGYCDLVRLVPAGGGALEFVAVEEAGGWRRFDFLLCPEQVESAELEVVLAEVDARGGKWVRVFGGFLTVVLPPDSSWCPGLAKTSRDS